MGVLDAVKYIAVTFLGYAAGRALGLRPPAVLFTAVVVVLVFFVSANAGPVVMRNLGLFLAVAAAYALALVLFTSALGSLVDRKSSSGAPSRPAISIYVAAALAAGITIGGLFPADYSPAIEPLLLFLLFIAGMDISRAKLRLDKWALAAPLVAIAAAAPIGALFATLFHITPAVAFGMGWYSFTGPYLTKSGDPVGGAYGLLVNFLREQFTFLLGPILARKFGKSGVLAAGGATTMDNTLPLYVALYGSQYALYAFANGFILTVAVPLLVPLVHQLYIAQSGV